MIVWNVFDGQGNYKLTCPTEESANKVAETYMNGWSAKPVDTDFGGEFADKALYTVNIPNDMKSAKAVLNTETEQYGYTKNQKSIPYIRNYCDEHILVLFAENAWDAINKALRILDGKEEHI